MSLTRRRFLQIACAASVAHPAAASARWQGYALGANASITLNGTGSEAAMDAALATIRRMERLFSLYDPNSSLSVLNRTGQLVMPPEFAALVTEIDQIHRATGKLFDPTVQSLWQALATGRHQKPTPIGWHRVKTNGRTLKLPPHMQLTFNGIAQGFATDRVKSVLGAHGFEEVIVNIGEYAIGSKPARIGVADPDNTLIQDLTLREEAAATSSPDALQIANGTSHILHPRALGAPAQWRTVTVIAKTATLADGLSTALTLTSDSKLIEKISNLPGVRKILTVPA